MDQALIPDSAWTKEKFLELLKHPAVTDTPLPSDFDVDVESTHLEDLWKEFPGLQKYEFLEFVHAGGSGMVFKVQEALADTWALKLAREDIYSKFQEDQVRKPEQANAVISEAEVTALQHVNHPNVVKFHEKICTKEGAVVGLVTSYVDRPKPINEFLVSTRLQEEISLAAGSELPFAPEELDEKCAFLIERCMEIASALSHLHSKAIYHCDIKSANILIGSNERAILTDLGASVTVSSLQESQTYRRINFTWTYAHPELKDLEKDVRSISGGGLKVSVEIEPNSGNLCRYDLFAFGRTIQESLATLLAEFGERCFASYGFRFLHLIGCLLLDGKNTPAKEHERSSEIDGRKFVSDLAMEYPVDLFAVHKITSADELVERLDRFTKDYSWHGRIPELNP